MKKMDVSMPKPQKMDKPPDRPMKSEDHTRRHERESASMMKDMNKGMGGMKKGGM